MIENTVRPWGHYNVIYNTENCKVKTLIIQPQQSLSMQRHKSRRELWFVSEGSCYVYEQLDSGYKLPVRLLNKHDIHKIDINAWHKLSNPFNTPCTIVEIQYGTKCVEEDIERKE